MTVYGIEMSEWYNQICAQNPILSKFMQTEKLDSISPSPLGDPLKRYTLIQLVDNPCNSSNCCWLIPTLHWLPINEGFRPC